MYISVCIYVFTYDFLTCTYIYIFVLIAPGPPSKVELTTISSTSLTLSWEASQMPNGVISGYTYMCIDINDTTTMYNISDNVPSGQFSVDILNLRPYTEYMCSVNGSTSAGVGTSAGDTGVTSQAGL